MSATVSRSEFFGARDLCGELDLAFPHGLGKQDRFMLTLTAYFDDSGTHNESQAIAVAGYISTAEQWLLFNQDWSAAISEWGLKYFHMTEYANRAGVYGSWTEIERRDRFARLVAIINKHTLASVSNGFLRNSYNLVFDKETKRFVGPYAVAASMCFIEAAQSIEPLYPSARVAYVFEDGSKGKGQVLSAYDMNASDDDNRSYLKLLSIRFEDKRDFPPLQAADILAYEHYRHIPKCAGISAEPARTELRQLVPENEQHIKSWGWVPDSELMKWATVLKAAYAYHGRKPLREVADKLCKSDKQRRRAVESRQ